MAAEAAASRQLARAKVNLCLHLRGRRPDGYHLLDSLVVFPEAGDLLEARAAPGLSLEVTGAFAGGLAGDNLVLRAACKLADRQAVAQGAALRLEKNLPVASGIGGGSSDAAAALGLLSGLWGVPVPDDLPAALGADVPVCLRAPRAMRMQGIGERLTPAPRLPEFWLVLVNPLVALATGAVFARVRDRDPPPGPEAPESGFASFEDMAGWLSRQRNDLQDPAIELCPVIGDVLAALSGAPLARMSGSGATCFALVRSEADATAMADRLARSGWWVAAAPVALPESGAGGAEITPAG